MREHNQYSLNTVAERKEHWKGKEDDLKYTMIWRSSKHVLRPGASQIRREFPTISSTGNSGTVCSRHGLPHSREESQHHPSREPVCQTGRAAESQGYPGTEHHCPCDELLPQRHRGTCQPHLPCALSQTLPGQQQMPANKTVGKQDTPQEGGQTHPGGIHEQGFKISDSLLFLSCTLSPQRTQACWRGVHWNTCLAC